MSVHAIDTDEIAAACRDIVPTADHGELVRAIRDATGLDLKLGFVDDGWYRLGGVVDGSGKRIAADLEDWVAEETGGDMLALFNKYGDAGYRFTRFTGRRVYLTAATGPNPLDFIQIEIDQVQELLCRPLFEGDQIPDTVEDLAALPLMPTRTPMGPQSYVFRRTSDFAAMPELLCEHQGDMRLKRFIGEWSKSSAAHHGHFADRWVLRVAPFRTEDGENVLEARPMTAIKVEFPDLQDAREHAAEYKPTRLVQNVDQQAGFPMAWYFLQVAQHEIHFHCMADLRDEFLAPPPGVAQLGKHDFELLEGWVDSPYTFK